MTERHELGTNRAPARAATHTRSRDYAGHHDRIEPLGASPQANEPRTASLRQSRRVTRRHTISPVPDTHTTYREWSRHNNGHSHATKATNHHRGDPTNPLGDPALDTRETTTSTPLELFRTHRLRGRPDETTDSGTLSQGTGQATLHRRSHGDHIRPAAMNECAPAHQSTAPAFKDTSTRGRLPPAPG